MRVMVLTDGKRIQVSETEEGAITRELTKPAERLVVQGVTYKKSLIGYFDDPSNQEIEAHRVLELWPESRIAARAGNRCVGTNSIQREINNIARDEGGSNWAKLVTDPNWREATRAKLREARDDWCDHAANECVCEEAK